jgi:hypothetical protein
MNRDEFMFKTLETMMELSCSPVFAICHMIKRQVQKTDFTVNARGSSFLSFESNSLDYAIKQFLSVNYGGNENTIIGNAVHDGADFGYKFFLETREYPKKRHINKEIIESVIRNYETIKPDLRDSISVKELIIESLKLFKKYSPVMLKNVPIESEKKMFLEVPEEMLQNPDNLGKIRFTGTLDRIYDSKGKRVLSDLKTSKKRISAGVEYSRELTALVDREKKLLELLKKLEKEIVTLEKIKVKQEDNKKEIEQVSAEFSTMVFSNVSYYEKELKEKMSSEEASTREVNSLKKEIEELQGYIIDYELFNTSTSSKSLILGEPKSIKRVLAKLVKLIKVRDNGDVDVEKVIHKKNKTQKELDEISLKIEPLKREWLVLVKKAEIEIAKSQYGTQLAFYAMVYMILEKVKIDKLRVEILVKNKKEPFVQIIEWDLDEAFMRTAYEKIQVTVSTIEAVLNGIDPMILFRANSTSYIGSDTNEVISEINEIISEGIAQ